MNKEYLILVDKNDNEVGQEEKLAAHLAGKLHRAFSIFVFNNKQELLLQQRALCKYHSPGLWTNTCCGHPRPGESTINAAKRRLLEEVGIVCELKHVGTFSYRAALESPVLIEHEIDHVFCGFFDGVPLPNPHEAKDIRWINYVDLGRELRTYSQNFSAWFAQALAIAYREVERKNSCE